MQAWIILFLFSLVLPSLLFGDQDDARPYDKLEIMINNLHSKQITEAPEKILVEIRGIKNSDYPHMLPEPTQFWLHQRLSIFDDEDLQILSKFPELKKPDAVQQLLTATFWCKIHNKPFELQKRIREIREYWLEREKPDIRLSPLGGGEVNWLWDLDTKDRSNGKIHVGIDSKTRMFLCYEVGKGLYFPTGIVLERIRAEIVQNRNVAGSDIGSGYLERHSVKPRNED